MWTVSPDGSDQSKVLDSDGCEMGNDPWPVRAPDGKRVAFVGCGTRARVIVTPTGGGTPQRIDGLLWRSWCSGGLTIPDLVSVMGTAIYPPR